MHTPYGRQRSFSFLVCLIVTGAMACRHETAAPEPVAGLEPFFPLNFIQSYNLVRDCRFSIEHDGHNIIVYASPEAADAYINGVYPFQPGAVVVKVLYNDPNCAQLAGYVAMRKGQAGTAPQSGDWEWQSVGVDGKVQSSGQLVSCISCHTGCTNGRDFTCTDP
jgi:hypothetical protein